MMHQELVQQLLPAYGMRPFNWDRKLFPFLLLYAKIRSSQETVVLSDWRGLKEYFFKVMHVYMIVSKVMK